MFNVVVRCRWRDSFITYVFIDEESQIQHFQNPVANKYRMDLYSRPGHSLEFARLFLASENPLNFHEIFVYKIAQEHFFPLRKGVILSDSSKGSMT